MRQNPFYNTHPTTPHEVPDFGQIQLEDYEPAILEGIKREEAFIDKLVANPEEPTFDNTIAVYADDNLLERVCGVFQNMLGANTNDELDALAQKLSPILAEHAQKMAHNKAYFQRVKRVYEHHRDLTPEEQTLLENAYKGFIRSGANLNEQDQEHMRAIVTEMGQLSLQYSQNKLKETNAFQLHITDEKELSGLPASALEAAECAAKETGKDGYLFTLQAPSYGPFITYADNRELRKQLYVAQATLCAHDNEYNNLPLVQRIVNLHREYAQLLGYKTYADFVLERRMAQTTQKVYDLFEQLLQAYMPVAKQEFQEVVDYAHQLEGDDFDFQPWDLSYYSHKLKVSKYDFDAEVLRPYFELSRVKAGVFGLAETLYGIRFQENKDIPVYHPDVTAYEVFDKDGTFLAVLYTDFHPRASKRSGAWMSAIKEQWFCPDGTNSRPQVMLVMNFTKPTEQKPALLTLGEVTTFLHEFGHALHGIFANTRFSSLSGTNVFWDFVELPSQFMENYAMEPSFLKTFARHYETNEPLPETYIQRILDSRNYHEAMACVRQVGLGMLDMAYYTLDKPFETDIKTFEHEAWQQTLLMPPYPEACMTTQFSHIMAGGYAAGYYSYKWAEVLDADAFSVFQQEGIFNTTTAQRFRDEVLSRGGTEHPMTLYKRFRGQEPSIKALMRRNGILP